MRVQDIEQIIYMDSEITQNYDISGIGGSGGDVVLPNRSSYAPCAVRPNKLRNIGVWSRDRLIAGPRKENWWLMLKRPELPPWFWGKRFLKAKYGVWAAGCVTFF